MRQFVRLFVLAFFLDRHSYICTRTSDLFHPYWWHLVALLRSSIQSDNQLKWIYVPQYSLHYSFNCETCFSLMCHLKCQNNFLKCWIPDERTIGSFRDLPNYIFSFRKPGPILPHARSDVGSDPHRFCGFCCNLVTVSGRHGSGGSALAWFSLVSVWLCGCGDHHLTCDGL